MPKINGSIMPEFKNLVLLKSLRNTLLLIRIINLKEQRLIKLGSLS